LPIELINNIVKALEQNAFDDAINLSDKLINKYNKEANELIRRAKEVIKMADVARMGQLEIMLLMGNHDATERHIKQAKRLDKEHLDVDRIKPFFQIYTSPYKHGPDVTIDVDNTSISK
jgi:hypothetical protein